MSIRPRIPTDDADIARITDAAFRGLGESRLIQALRDAAIAAIELVAVDDTAVVGHILFSALDVMVDSRAVKALALAPMAVHPSHQRQGIGSALVRSGLEQARANGWEAVIVLGHPRYYPRFGFTATQARHLEAPYSGDTFMALALRPGTLDGQRGRVVYPTAFSIVD